MRKLKLQTQVSLDGFIEGPNGEMDWMIWDWDDELNNYVNDITQPVDTILLGRKLAEGFIPHWESLLNNPETADDSARKMVETHKIVFTKTLENSDWKNTDLAKGDLTDEITTLKHKEGQDLIAYGGGQFVSSLIKEGLIDEYHLFFNPAILGRGMTIFKEVDYKRNMKIINSKSFDCGIVVIQYVPEKSA